MIVRSARRIPLRCPIAFSGDGLEGRGRTIDVSAGGWKVASDQSVSKGSYLSLRVHLPDHDKPLEVDLVSVRWAAGKEFGLVSLRMHPAAQERLTRFLETHDSGPSA